MGMSLWTTDEKRKFRANRWWAPCVAMALAALPIANGPAFSYPIGAQSNLYRTSAWDGKFLYGAYSTLIATHLMGREFPHLIVLLSRPDENEQQIARLLAAYQYRYQNLSKVDVEAILAFARENRSPTIFQEERSVLETEDQIDAFIKGMFGHPEFKPVDHQLSEGGGFSSTNFQFNTHRGLYNVAYGIPQNSLAAIVAGYVVGIRNFEMDVLETKDHRNVVIHDLPTNRLNGNFGEPPVYVEKLNYSDIENTAIDILNPLASKPEVFSTGVKRIMPTEAVLGFVRRHMPEITLYIDARNDSPVSFLRLLKVNEGKGYQNNVVLKIYPFTLSGGAYDLINRYAEREKITQDKAAEEIASIKAHVLLALGSAPGQAQEAVQKSNLSDLTFDRFSKDLTSLLPFSRVATKSKNLIGGEKIFDDDQLARLEALTFITFRWATDFAAVADVAVFQVALMPSLAHLAASGSKSDVEEFRKMPDGDRLIAAVTDNFNALYSAVHEGKTRVILKLPDGKSTTLHDRLQKTIYGFSDRYPDFAFKIRSNDAGQFRTKDFLYSMQGVVYEKNDYASLKMRSTAALSDKVREMKADGLPIQYSTTDLPTDLRAAMMGILGNHGLPADLTYRANSIVKRRYAPQDVAAFVPPPWSTHLYGDLYNGEKGDRFGDDLTDIQKKNGELSSRRSALQSLETAIASPSFVIVNPVLLEILNKTSPSQGSQVKTRDFDAARHQLEAEIRNLDEELHRRMEVFRQSYGIRFDGEVEDDPYFPSPPSPM